MTYAIWSRGRMIGETELEGVFGLHGFRYGTFVPTPAGEPLLECATGVSRAVLAVGKDADDEARRTAWMSATAAEQALQLELRDASGRVVETQYVSIADLEFLAKAGEAIADEYEPDGELSAEDQAEIDAAAEELIEEWESNREPWKAEPEETELPRYQVRVLLVDPNALPPA